MAFGKDNSDDGVYYIDPSNGNKTGAPSQLSQSNTLFRLVGNGKIKEDRSKTWYTPPNKPPPAYYRIHTGQADKKIYDIEYWLFYPYNGPTSLGVILHEGDWQQVTARVYVDENAKDDEPKSQVLGVWMSAHTEGSWWAPSIYKSNGSDIGPLDFEEGRPIVYSAINTHANYDTDRQFDEKTNVINNWVKFRGKWGRYVDYLVGIGSGPITPIEAGNINDPAQWKSQKFPFDPIPK
ncbi:15865_t:CDS:2 [Funneliformis mosseae]|uniref:15865_t:CDS:1 n=1 Tax=Funneliformis mosseae TaxID=27381 RepID=A0A9N9C3C2_FUNMO|nr:15865_t:CDS:2 [Funneliformis mosseae]